MLRLVNRHRVAGGFFVVTACMAFSDVAVAEQATAEKKAVELPQLVVSATSTERMLRDAPASVTVISGEELRERPVLDLTDALRGSPGVTINDVGLGRRGISIRGMPDDYTLILVDGKRTNNASSAIAHADFDLGWVPVEAIERIELVRGPMSSLYGSEALGGVVNIITRAATDHWQGSANLRGGIQQGTGGDEYQAGVYIAGPIVPGKLGMSFTGEVTGRGETPDAFNPQLSEVEEREAQNGALTLTFTPDEAQRIDLGYSYGKEKRVRDTQTVGGVPVPYTSTDDVWRQHLSLSHTGKWSWGETRLRAYRSQLDRDNSRTVGVPTGSTKLIDDVLDGQVTVPVFSNHVVSAGGEWRKESLEDPTVNAQGEDDAQRYALFLQDEWQLSSNLSLVIGNRADHHEQYGWENSPRAYLVYHPTEAWTLRGGVGQGFKAPTLKELSPGYQAVAAGGRFTIIGNPDLQPETSTTYEFGVEYDVGNWKLGGTVFQNDLENLIQTRCILFCGIFGAERRTYENVDEAQIRGIEIGGGVNLPWDFRLDANYTHLDTEDKTTGLELTERPRHAANVTLAWFPLDDLTAQLRGEYVGRQVIVSGASRLDLEAYSIWSTDISYELSDSTTLRGGIENIFDERLVETSVNYPYAERRRMLWVGLGYSF